MPMLDILALNLKYQLHDYNGHQNVMMSLLMVMIILENRIYFLCQKATETNLLSVCCRVTMKTLSSRAQRMIMEINIIELKESTEGINNITEILCLCP